jgi:hypothetical protein
LEFNFEGEVIYWRGPAPFLFVALPLAIGAEIEALGSAVSYGWGCVPVLARIGEVAFKTSLFPRNGSYVLPLKVAARRALPPMDVGDRLVVQMTIAPR